MHKKLNKLVAVKIIAKGNLSENANILVRNEIEILKICHHPNIVRIYDVFENLDFIYISIYKSYY